MASDRIKIAGRVNQCVDVFEGIAPLLRARPIIDDFCRFGSDWSAVNERTDGGQAWFHLITRGCCVLDRVGYGPLTVREGDILLLPRGDAHVVRSPDLAAGEGCVEFPNAVRQSNQNAGSGETELICGRLDFEMPGNPILAILPDLLLMHSNSEVLGRLGTLVVAVRDELDGGRLGGVLMATELASVLFLMLLRLHLEEAPPVEGLVGLLAEPVTARAVTVLMKDLSRTWTLDELAREAATSRATLVRSFRRISGLTPLAFATELRLDLARSQLVKTSDPIADIAARAGYQSEQAFSRAMVKRFGLRPGAIRRAKPG